MCYEDGWVTPWLKSPRTFWFPAGEKDLISLAIHAVVTCSFFCFVLFARWGGIWGPNPSASSDRRDSNLKSADSPVVQLSLLLFLGSWWLYPFKTLSFMRFSALYCWSQVCVEVSVKTFGFGFLISVRRAFTGVSLIKSCLFAPCVLCLCCWHHCAHFIFFFDVCFYLLFVLLSAQPVCTQPHALLSVTPAFNHKSGLTPRTDGWSAETLPRSLAACGRGGRLFMQPLSLAVLLCC